MAPSPPELRMPDTALPGDRVLLALKTRGPLATAELGKVLGVTGEAARQQLERLAATRSAEGYMATVRKAGDGWLLVENHCPICAAARACQGFCRSELELFREVLGEGVEIERVEHVLAGGRRCAYSVREAAAMARRGNRGAR